MKSIVYEFVHLCDIHTQFEHDQILVYEKKRKRRLPCTAKYHTQPHPLLSAK